MPRNGSSVYSLPAGNPVIPGTIIATTWANTTLTDIATALTNSLSTDGSTAAVSLAGKTMSGGTFSGPAVTGVLTLTGGQIAFPAVQIPSANVNTLDDYEEGTWTPTITFATSGNLVVVYSTRVGQYTKIGNRVIADFNVITSTFTHTTASGNLRVAGLPFTSLATTGGDVTMSVSSLAGVSLNVAGGEQFADGYIVQNSTIIQFLGNNFTTRINFLINVSSVPTGGAQQYSGCGAYPTA